jgi:hypothetical protein
VQYQNFINIHQVVLQFTRTHWQPGRCGYSSMPFFLSYCTVFVVFNPTMKPNVQCLAVLDHFMLRVYVICHFWTLICNLWGYWRHHLICYTSVFTTPLVVTTISVYSVLWPSDVVSRSSPLISSVICSVISLQCLYLVVSSISVPVCRPSNRPE